MNAERNESVTGHNAALAIFWGGLWCAVLDIGYAFALYGLLGVRPVRLLQGIASGMMGPSAFRGGLQTAAFGLFLHFLIAYGAATVYFVASRNLRFMVRQAFLAGLLYGVAVHLFMNFIVIPLSLVAHRPLNLGIFVLNGFEHMLLVGLPIALAVRRFSDQQFTTLSRDPFQEAGSRTVRA